MIHTESDQAHLETLAKESEKKVGELLDWLDDLGNDSDALGEAKRNTLFPIRDDLRQAWSLVRDVREKLERWGR